MKVNTLFGAQFLVYLQTFRDGTFLLFLNPWNWDIWEKVSWPKAETAETTHAEMTLFEKQKTVKTNAVRERQRNAWLTPSITLLIFAVLRSPSGWSPSSFPLLPRSEFHQLILLSSVKTEGRRRQVKAEHYGRKWKKKTQTK